MGRVIKRHGPEGGHHRTATDDELDAAFGLNRKDNLVNGDLAYVRNRPGGPNITGTGTLLAQYIRYDDTSGAWEFFGSSFSAKSSDVEIVRRVTVVWA